MYKTVFFLLLHCIIPFGYAQNYHPMLNHSSEWHLTSCFSNCITDVYYTDGDTLLNNISYKVLNGFHYISRTFWLREDTPQQQVFISYLHPSHGREEELLYDFSLIEGDTMIMKNPASPFPYNGGEFILDSVVPISLLNGISYRQYFFSPASNNPSMEKPMWIESIGSLGLINSPGGTPNVLGAGKLSCHFDNENLIYSQLDSINGCAPVYLNNISMNKLEKFVVYPNPVDEQVKVSGSTNVSAIKIMDLQGKERKILRSEKSLPFELNLSDLESGVFFLYLTTNEGLVQVEKLFKN